MASMYHCPRSCGYSISYHQPHCNDVMETHLSLCARRQQSSFTCPNNGGFLCGRCCSCSDLNPSPRVNVDGSPDMRCSENRSSLTHDGWTQVATEHNCFTLSVTQEVRYGIGNNWVVKIIPPGTAWATNGFFGCDPAHGKGKVAQVRSVEKHTFVFQPTVRPSSPSALQLAEQLEKAILTEAKRRVEKEKADEEARIQAEAKRRLEAERAAAATRRSDDVEARIQAAMDALRKQ